MRLRQFVCGCVIDRLLTVAPPPLYITQLTQIGTLKKALKPETCQHLELVKPCNCYSFEGNGRLLPSISNTLLVHKQTKD